MDEVSFDIEVGSDVPHRVRDALGDALASWRDRDAVQRAIQVANELVTNAMTHDGDRASVTIERDPQKVRVTVEDGDERMPQLLEPTVAGEGGRGMWLVAQMSESWGVEPRPGGKAVWFVVEARA